MHPTLSAAFSGEALSPEQALELTRLLPGALLGVMAAAAASAAASGTEQRPFTCGIVNAKSGMCPENCAFCSQSAHNQANPPVHGLIGEDELFRRAEAFERYGVDRMGIVTSGTGPVAGEFERLCRTAEKLTANFNLRFCASLGILGADQAAALKQAGISRYHHNLETAPSFYSEICTSHSLEPRIRTVRIAAEAGLEVCCGGIFGLGESWEQRVEMFSLIRDLPVDCVPVNFLNPVPGTALAHRRPPGADEALAVIAVLRLMQPGRGIVVCGGRGGALGRFATLVFSAGANGLMVGDYLTTRGGALDEDMELLRTLGIRPPEGKS